MFFEKLERAWEAITGAIDAVEAVPTVEEECQAQKAAYAYGEAYDDWLVGLPLDPKMVDDAVKEVATVANLPRSAREVCERIWAESHLLKMGPHTHSGDAAHPCVLESSWSSKKPNE